ncbi:hypothetical protein GGF46_005223 [Coemansia sp. RSA 552]|nr:hypothetical protein GGF46_005223 [Coemansia sp. RSA 552]
MPRSKADGDAGATPAAAQDGLRWRKVGGTWIGKWGAPVPAAKLAAFDLDATLICVKGKGRFPKDAHDWRFFHPDVPQVLRRIHQQGYRVVIISNQYGLRQRDGHAELPKKAVEFRLKVANIAKQVGIPLTVFMATLKDYMRKPSPGMWHLAQLDNGDVAVDGASSFYVGDAAGRLAGWRPGALADFSDSDHAFALNANLPFYTPEEVFTKSICAKEAPLPLPPPRSRVIARFAPRSLAPAADAHSRLLAAIAKHVSAAKEAGCGLLVVLVGPPACGKSTFATKHLGPLGIERVNMDELKTRKRCDDAVRRMLRANGCVVVDNTNPDATARGSFAKIAGESGAACVAVVFEHGSRDLALHNNNFRTQVSQARYFAQGQRSKDSLIHLDGVPPCADRVPDVAYHSYFKRFAPPSPAEGFAEVLTHTFMPAFDDPSDELLWNQYY